MKKYQKFRLKKVGGAPLSLSLHLGACLCFVLHLSFTLLCYISFCQRNSGRTLKVLGRPESDQERAMARLQASQRGRDMYQGSRRGQLSLSLALPRYISLLPYLFRFLSSLSFSHCTSTLIFTLRMHFSLPQI